MAVNEIVKLTDSNWNVWKFQTKILLKSKKLFDIVSGEMEKPSGSDLEDFMTKDSQAQAIIVSRMEEKQLSYVLDCETSTEMWAKLLTVYERKSEVSLHLLQSKFFNMKFDNEGIMMFISRINEIVSQIRQLGEEISEKMVITKILMSLPERYKHFLSAWESVPPTDQNMNELTSRLLIEEERQQSTETSDQTSAAFMVNKNVICFNCGKRGHMKRNCTNKSQQRHNLFCNYCKKKGHSIQDCRLRNNVRRNQRDQKDAFICSAFIGNTQDDGWYLDSGASEHMTFKKEWFSKYTEYDVPQSVKIGDGRVLEVLGIGDIAILTHNKRTWFKHRLSDVLYVPSLKVNLFSMGTVLSKGFGVYCENNECLIKDNDRISAVAYRVDKLFKMKFIVKTVESSGLVAEKTIKDWHECLAHQNVRQVKTFLKNNEVQVTNDKNFYCEPCQVGKMHKLPYKQSETKTDRVNELIHADLCGPMEVESIGGSRYFLLVKDDYSHFRKVFFLKNKSEVKDCFVKFLKFAYCATGNKIKTLRTDNGTEFVNHDMKRLLEKKGIVHQTTIPYSPQQNGKAEREMRTVVEAARTMLKDAGLGKSLWAEATSTAVYVLNRSGTSSIQNKTPYELYFNKEHNDLKFKRFGSEVYVHIPKEKRRKWDAKGKKGIFVGYDNYSKGYRVYFEKERNVTIHRDVSFVPQQHVSGNKETDYMDTSNENPGSVKVEVADNVEIELSHDEEEETETQKVPYNLRKRSQLVMPERMKDFEVYLTSSHLQDEPSSYKQAMKSSDAENWKMAMNTEMNTLLENNTWTEVKKPENVKIINSRWVYKVKRNETGEIVQHKARLVAKGFQQDEQFDISDIYTPVAKMTSFRILLSLACRYKMPIYQMDVTSAFLNGDIKEDVYMNRPEGYDDDKEMVLKLNKSLYGLKKSPKYWNDKFDGLMKKLKFNRTTNDNCLYYKVNGEDDQLYVLLYVDDLIIVGTKEEDIAELKKGLSNNFKMKDLGLISTYLGIQVEQTEEKIKINQSVYLKKVLEDFGMSDCKPVSTPMDPNFKVEELNQEEVDLNLEEKCRRVIGCLMYAMLGSRPDLCAAMSILSRYQSKPSENLWKSLKRLLRYVKGTVDLSLVYKCDESCPILVGYADADWAGDGVDRKSTSGYMFKLFGNTICWSSRKQATVALSSSEAEYVALSSAISEGVWLKSLLQTLNQWKEDPVIIYEDNQSAICNAKKEDHKRMKHIDIKHHFIKDKIKKGEIVLKYICSREQLADVLTKPLNKDLFCKHVLDMGLS